MKLGVIGGLGPMATAYFMELVVQMTKAQCDQEHLEMIIYNSPGIPDRTDYILGKNARNPVLQMIEIGKKLKEQDVSCIAIPCITAHYFHKQLEREIGCKVLHPIRDTAQVLNDAGIDRVGLMATDGTIQSKIFQRQIEESNMEALLPDEENQKRIMNLIYRDVKSGKKPDMDELRLAADSLFAQGAQVIILGCTELSVIKRDHDLGAGFIDSMEVLARSSIKSCGKEVKEDYHTLFTLHDGQ